MESEDNEYHSCDECKLTPHSPASSPETSPELRRRVVYHEHRCSGCKHTPHSPTASPQSTPKTSRRGSWNDVNTSVGHIIKTLKNKNRKYDYERY